MKKITNTVFIILFLVIFTIPIFAEDSINNEFSNDCLTVKGGDGSYWLCERGVFLHNKKMAFIVEEISEDIVKIRVDDSKIRISFTNTSEFGQESKFDYIDVKYKITFEGLDNNNTKVRLTINSITGKELKQNLQVQECKPGERRCIDTAGNLKYSQQNTQGYYGMHKICCGDNSNYDYSPVCGDLSGVWKDWQPVPSCSENKEKTSNQEEKDEEKQTKESNSKKIEEKCNGCKQNEVCLPIGTRLTEENKPRYCDIDLNIKEQKTNSQNCQNNYECSTNQCSNNECVNLTEELKETRSLIQKLFDLLSKIFG
ncbi:hypothetical protein J4216_02260 [Candidatus Woesearchaeota archaeon]|nr:hypothetical protein [Candidatus Woesearchaeota archaeon]